MTTSAKSFPPALKLGVAAAIVGAVGLMSFGSIGQQASVAAASSGKHSTNTDSAKSATPAIIGGERNAGGPQGNSSAKDAIGTSDKMSGSSSDAKAKFEQGVAATREGTDAVGRRGGKSTSG